MKEGDIVIVGKVETPNGPDLQVADIYRLPELLGITILFLVLAVVVGRWRGLSAIVGLAFTVVVLLGFIVPQIVAGKNPLWVCLLGALLIATISIYFAHGLHKRTTIAIISTVVTMLFSVVISYIFIKLANISGAGTEEAVYIQAGFLNNLDLSGLLLGGILIGTLGILNDITTAQSAAVDEIKKAQPEMSIKGLYASGMSVGGEHIASLINTLVLAYASVGLPTFILFALGRSQPAWVALNSAPLAEEIVRTVVGSLALVAAVPITTALAAWYFGRVSKTDQKDQVL